MFESRILKSGVTIFIALILLINAFTDDYAIAAELFLPAPGVMVRLSRPFEAPILKGMKVYPDNPFRFDFILDKGDAPTRGHGFSRVPRQVAKRGSSESESDPEEQAAAVELKQEATKLIKYFLAGLTIPEKDLWVNLSPYEKDRIVPQSFGLTEMGRDLLAEDYMLKQITASLIYPEDQIGKKFWKRIYEEAQKKFGTTNIPVNTFNKVWIVPEKAVVYENAKAGTAYVVESRLKVMLDQDYLALKKNENSAVPQNDVNALGSKIVREIVLPELEKEINEGQNFSQLRQVYDSLILATWYKKKIKDSILAQVYADKKKVEGVGYDKSGNNKRNDIELIYRRYLQAFKKGVYNYIREEPDPVTQGTVPRKYFSGGMDVTHLNLAMTIVKSIPDAAMARPAFIINASVMPMRLEDNSDQLWAGAIARPEVLNLGGMPRWLDILRRVLRYKNSRLQQFITNDHQLTQEAKETIILKVLVLAQKGQGIQQIVNAIFGEWIPRFKRSEAIYGVLGTGGWEAEVHKYSSTSLKSFPVKGLRFVYESILGLPLDHNVNREDYIEYVGRPALSWEVQNEKIDCLVQLGFLPLQDGRGTKIYNDLQYSGIIPGDLFPGINHDQVELRKREPERWGVNREKTTSIGPVPAESEYIDFAKILLFVSEERLDHRRDAHHALVVRQALAVALPHARYPFFTGSGAGRLQYPRGDISDFPDSNFREQNHLTQVLHGLMIDYLMKKYRLTSRLTPKDRLLVESLGRLFDTLIQGTDTILKKYGEDRRKLELHYLSNDWGVTVDAGKNRVIRKILALRHTGLEKEMRRHVQNILDQADSLLIAAADEAMSAKKSSFEDGQLSDFLFHNPYGLAIRVTSMLKDFVTPAELEDVKAKRVGSTLDSVKAVTSNINGGFAIRVGTNIYFSNNRSITIRKNEVNHRIEVIADGWKNKEELVKYLVSKGLGLNVSPAQITQAPNTGGIDLSPVSEKLQTKNNNGEIKFFFNPAMLAQLQNAPGFMPVIINIQPLNNLLQFLGISSLS